MSIVALQPNLIRQTFEHGCTKPMELICSYFTWPFSLMFRQALLQFQTLGCFLFSFSGFPPVFSRLLGVFYLWIMSPDLSFFVLWYCDIYTKVPKVTSMSLDQTLFFFLFGIMKKYSFIHFVFPLKYFLFAFWNHEKSNKVWDFWRSLSPFQMTTKMVK